MQDEQQKEDLCEPAPLVVETMLSTSLSPAIADRSNSIQHQRQQLESGLDQAIMKTEERQEVASFDKKSKLADISCKSLQQTQQEIANEAVERATVDQSDQQENDGNANEPVVGHQVDERQPADKQAGAATDEVGCEKRQPGVIDRKGPKESDTARETVYKLEQSDESNIDNEPREFRKSPSSSKVAAKDEIDQFESGGETVVSAQVVGADKLVGQQVEISIDTPLVTATEARVEAPTCCPTAAAAGCLLSPAEPVSQAGSISELESNATLESPAASEEDCPHGNQQGASVKREPFECSSCNSDIDDDLVSEEDVSLKDYGCESVSKQNLRRLKMDASEDVLVCERNREHTEAARFLFETLDRQRDHKNYLRTDANIHQSSTVQRSGSLNSNCSPDGEEDDELAVAEENNNNEKQSRRDQSVCKLSLCDQIYDIKIVKRSGSSLSTSGFRRTLVCSVSPTSQMGSNSDMSLQDAQSLYPIDDEEMMQCKMAFRENKRLIEKQQENGNLSTLNARPVSSRSNDAYNTWTLRNKNNIPQTNCTHCKQRLYPVDKIELDFTRTTLNIHRNCFKCQVCFTLLRLETYVAIDAKLYCPAHVKCVTTIR